MRYLTEPAQQRVFAHNNFEFAADPDVAPAEEIAQFGTLQARPDRRAGRRRAPRGRAAADGGGGVGLTPTRRRPDGATVLTVALRSADSRAAGGASAQLHRGPGRPLEVLGLPAGGDRGHRDPARGGGDRHARARHVARRARVVLRLPRALLDRVDPGASAGHARLRVHALRARAGRARTCARPLGAVCIFTLVLYPYVYLLARASFLGSVAHAPRGGPRARACRAGGRSCGSRCRSPARRSSAAWRWR